jgi:hypothetical protein
VSSMTWGTAPEATAPTPGEAAAYLRSLHGAELHTASTYRLRLIADMILTREKVEDELRAQLAKAKGERA